MLCPLPGLGKGGQQIQTCRKSYISAIKLLVQLANLQTAFLTLDLALKTTNRRVNALENVVKPRIENTISYIKVWHRHRAACSLLHPCTVAVRSRPMQPIGTHPGRLAATLAVCGGVESGVGVPCTCPVLVLPHDTQLEQLASGSGAQGWFIAAVLSHIFLYRKHPYPLLIRLCRVSWMSWSARSSSG
jgi:hypothetical protein